MANFFTDNVDLQYYVDKGIDWAPLIDAVEFPRTDTNKAEMIESYREVLELLGTFSGEQIGPYADELDSQEMRVVDGEVDRPTYGEILESAQDLTSRA